ncbi:phosphonate ABC transporter substrate-binding protein [Caldimonas brevitalea]|uniref:Alkylphosphonate ABC transporter substrate-binding protein n=1 Tax=Caldimonas brevitalea TaxID=413882 RepID=A0A0G3BLT8_9BURK|nr:phosphonate ABC transporter substrate-binding protein [Caldimonas brevitalea]AKJ30404.1 alkylphosphonate ABC transporter substrate-binding protein [Caldimonas brevitalea]
MKRRHLSLAALALGLLGPCAVAQTQTLNFGFISTESSQNLKSAWQPLLEDMQKATGLKVNAFFAPDYAGVIEAMRFNKVQVAWMGNKSALEAVDRAGGEVFAKVTQADGAGGYWSLMLVHKDSPLKSLDDVLKRRAELSLGFGDPNSTSGSLVPGYYAFAQNQVDPVKDFKRTVRANHETNILAVASKQVDVATVASDGVDRMKIKQPERHALLREVWRSPLIASDPMVWRKDLDAAARQKVRDFLLGYGRDAREKEILKTLTFAGFVASDNQQLLPIRQLELARDRAKAESDTTLSADEKRRRLQDIDARLAELQKLLASAK